MIFEGDFKGYDTTIPDHLIMRAFAILRSCYPDSKKIDNHFTYIFQNFCYKNLVVPGGFIYRINKGLPSGSSFTSLVGSIINIIVLIDIVMHYPGFKKYHISIDKVRFCVSGDDFLIIFPKGTKVRDKIFRLIGEELNEEDLNDWIAERHGMKIKKPSFRFGDSSSDDTIFGLMAREFHSDPLNGRPTPVYFFNKQEPGFQSKIKFSPWVEDEVNVLLSKVGEPTLEQFDVWMEALIPDYDTKKDMRALLKLPPKPQPVWDSTTLRDFANERREAKREPPQSGLQYERSMHFMGITRDPDVILKSYIDASNMCASFLKTIIFQGLPSIKFSDLFNRFFSPTSMCKKSFRLKRFLMSVLDSTPLYGPHTQWVAHFLAYVDFDGDTSHVDFKGRVGEYFDMIQIKYRKLYFEMGTTNELSDSKQKTKSLVIECKFLDCDLDRRSILRDFVKVSSNFKSVVGANAFDLGYFYPELLSRGVQDQLVSKIVTSTKEELEHLF